MKQINYDFERKRYCFTVFIYISQGSDQLQTMLPLRYLELLKSYLCDRHYFVQQDEQFDLQYSSGCATRSDYLLFILNIPVTQHTTIATFADDTAVLVCHQDPTTASTNLQQNLNELQQRLARWRMRANEKKSVHRERKPVPIYRDTERVTTATSS